MLTRVAKYDILEEIGHGGMATVFRARDTLLSRPVALKVMHPHLQGAKEARTRFAREAMTVARLKHPSILEIYDYSGEDNDTSYIATELLTGPTLKQFVEQVHDIPAEIAACICIQLARALGAAHAEGVVHRDVKPENVMLHEGRTVKLTDFGIAQLVDMQGMTTTGQVLGSPAHMAPEQIEGRECDARSDLFALGTVLYLLVTGELPFQGKNPHQVLKQIAEGNYRDPLHVRPQMGARMRGIVVKLLQVDRERRYASAKDLETDLQGFVAEAGIEDCSALLAEYLKDPAVFSAAFRERIIGTQTELAERACKAGDIAKANDAWNRVLAIDETNERVLAAVRRMGRRTLRRKVVAMSGLAALVCGLAVLLLAPPPQGSVYRPVESPSPPQTIEPSVSNMQPTAASSSDKQSVSADNGRPDAQRKPVVRPKPNGATSVSANGKEPRRVVLRPEPANVAISIDGSLPRDFGPAFRELDLLPGMHEFEFHGAHDCCVDETISMKIPPGPGTTVVEHRLKFRPAGLYVVSNVPANVIVDGGAVSGRARSVIHVPQPAGMFATHELRITADGHKDVVREVRLRAGQVESVNVTLEKSKGPSPPG
jgi:eukaryotic-like serine/threonine-protein kinase